MNAYELANYVADNGYIGTSTTHELANMLRQQADRIAELENQSQPVAWMEYIQDEEWEVWYTKPTDLPEGHSYKPLYLAPQTKPLSDEEIKKIWYNLYPLSSSSYWDDKREGLAELKFARAIEERHGIK